MLHLSSLPPTHDLRPPVRLRRRAALSTVFALNGFVFGSWASRVPDVSAHLHVSHSALGAALLCLSLGALASMQVVGRLCARFGAGRLTVAGMVALSVTAVGPGLVGHAVGLGLALAVFGVASGVLNVAMNSLGVQVEAEQRRPLLPLLHAAASFGGLAGALSGGLLATVASTAVHLAALAPLGLLLSVLVAPSLLRGAVGSRPGRDASPPAHRSRPAPLPRRLRRGVVVLGAIAACTAYGEGALGDWAALHLRSDLGAGATLAATAYAGFCLAMGVGRLAGAALLVRFGQTWLLVAGGLVAAAGMLIAALGPSALVAVTGFAVVGLGLSNMFPVALARAGALGGAAGVALATTIGYGGLLGGPPVIGVLSSRTGLPVALTSIAALALVAASLAVVLALRSGSEAAGPRLLTGWYRVAGAVRFGVPVGQLSGAVAADLSGRVRSAAHGHSRSLRHLQPTPGADAIAPLAPYPGLEHLVR